MYLRLLAAALLFLCLLAVVPALHIGETPGSKQALQTDRIVFVAGADNRFHSAYCSKLTVTHYAMTLSEAQRSGYTPCPQCEGSKP